MFRILNPSTHSAKYLEHTIQYTLNATANTIQQKQIF